MVDKSKISVKAGGLTLFIFSILGLIGTGFGGWEIVSGQTQEVPLKFWIGLLLITFVFLASILIAAVSKWDGEL